MVGVAQVNEKRIDKAEVGPSTDAKPSLKFEQESIKDTSTTKDLRQEALEATRGARSEGMPKLLARENSVQVAGFPMQPTVGFPIGVPSLPPQVQQQIDKMMGRMPVEPQQVTPQLYQQLRDKGFDHVDTKNYGSFDLSHLEHASMPAVFDQLKKAHGSGKPVVLNLENGDFRRSYVIDAEATTKLSVRDLQRVGMAVVLNFSEQFETQQGKTYKFPSSYSREGLPSNTLGMAMKILGMDPHNPKDVVKALNDLGGATQFRKGAELSEYATKNYDYRPMVDGKNVNFPGKYNITPINQHWRERGENEPLPTQQSTPAAQQSRPNAPAQQPAQPAPAPQQQQSPGLALTPQVQAVMNETATLAYKYGYYRKALEMEGQIQQRPGRVGLLTPAQERSVHQDALNTYKELQATMKQLPGEYGAVLQQISSISFKGGESQYVLNNYKPKGGYVTPQRAQQAQAGLADYQRMANHYNITPTE